MKKERPDSDHLDNFQQLLPLLSCLCFAPAPFRLQVELLSVSWLWNHLAVGPMSNANDTG